MSAVGTFFTTQYLRLGPVFRVLILNAGFWCWPVRASPLRTTHTWCCGSSAPTTGSGLSDPQDDTFRGAATRRRVDREGRNRGRGQVTGVGWAQAEAAAEQAAGSGRLQGLRDAAIIRLNLYQACVDAVANESDTTNNCGSFNQVTVLAKAAAKVELTPSSVSFTEIGATETLTIRVLDSDGDEISPNSLGWSSEDETVATVSGRPGQKISVKATGAGSTTVTVTANSNVTGTATVTVTPTGRRVEVSPNSLTFTALGDSKTVTVRVLDENDDVDPDASYSWFGLTYPGSTVDLERVTGGLKVTATEAGGGEFDIISTGASSAVLLVRVYQQPASVKVSPSSVTLAPGQKATMSVRVMDANGHDITLAPGRTGGRIVYWKTSNSAVASVDGADRLRDGSEIGATATVTAGTAGTATITARPGGETVEGTATVTVTTQ